MATTNTNTSILSNLAVSRAYAAGAYANAYTSAEWLTALTAWCNKLGHEAQRVEIDAFLAGFYGSYTSAEIVTDTGGMQSVMRHVGRYRAAHGA